MDPGLPRRVAGSARPLSRRDVLKLGAWLAGGSAAASVLAACAPRRADGSPVATPPGSGGPGASHTGTDGGPRTLTMLTGAGSDPAAHPALRSVFDDFAGLQPGLEWDIRSLTGSGPEWDRLARAQLASGEQVDLVIINGQQVGGWVRDGLLEDLRGEPALRDVLDRVPGGFQAGGTGEGATRAFPLAVTGGLHTTGLYYNKALLEDIGRPEPATIADLQAMVGPLAQRGAAPLVHCSGDVFFNQILITWVLPMIVERDGTSPHEFAVATVSGDVGYDSPEWIEAFRTIGELRTSGVLLEGSGGTGYQAMQQLLLQGRAMATLQGTWMVPQIQGGAPAVPFDLHVAPPPLVEGARRPRPIAAWAGFAIPAGSTLDRELVLEFLEYASRDDVDAAVVEGTQLYSPIAESNVAIADPLAQEFLPLFADAITPLDWLWEPEITAEIDSQVQGLVKGETDALAAGQAVQAVAEELRRTGRGYFS